jgi:thioesterase-3
LSVEIRVRGYHLDVYQHVNNGRYLEFLEEARWDFMSRSGFGDSLDKAGVALVIVNINVNYRRPAVMGDVLNVTARISHIGNKSARFEQLVTLKNDDGAEVVVVDADVTFCVMDRETEKALPIEGRIRDILASGMES